MKVFVVLNKAYEGDIFCGVFAAQTKAQEHCRDLIEEACCPFIVEYELPEEGDE